MPLFPYPLDKVSGVYQSTSGSGSRNQTLHAVVHHGSIQFITSVERERESEREREGENEFRTEVTITALEPGLCSHPRRPLEQPPPSAGRTPEPSLRVAGSTHRSDGAPPPSRRPSTSCQTTFTLVHNKRTQTQPLSLTLTLRRASNPGYLNYFVGDRNRYKRYSVST